MLKVFNRRLLNDEPKRTDRPQYGNDECHAENEPWSVNRKAA